MRRWLLGVGRGRLRRAAGYCCVRADPSGWRRRVAGLGSLDRSSCAAGAWSAPLPPRGCGACTGGCARRLRRGDIACRAARADHPAHAPPNAAGPPPSGSRRPGAPRSAADWEARIAGRWLNRIGLTAVAVGVAYFRKYAIDNGWIGLLGQVALVSCRAARVRAGPTCCGYVYGGGHVTGPRRGTSVSLHLAGGGATPPAVFAELGGVCSDDCPPRWRTPGDWRTAQRARIPRLLGGFLT